MLQQHPEVKRLRLGNYTELDQSLYEWLRFMQNRGVAVSRFLLCQKASEFWALLPIYEEIEAPNSLKAGWANGSVDIV